MTKWLLTILGVAAMGLECYAAGNARIVVNDGVTMQRLPGAKVQLEGAGTSIITNDDGVAEIKNLPDGSCTIRISAPGWMAQNWTFSAPSGNDVVSKSFVLMPDDRNTKDIVVYGASRVPTKLTDAPAAVGLLTSASMERNAPHGQVGKTLETLTGVDVVQSGANDFNINARGFNNSITRRMLVLVDGRDPSTPLINLNEWNSLSSSMEDISSIEVIRGPGSALYGQNAYNGVVNIRTLAPEQVQGTKVTLSVGEYESYRASVRHAGAIGEQRNLMYKVSLNASSQYNYSLTSRMRDTTKPLNGLEYAGISPDLRPLSDEAKHPYQAGGTLRMDYMFRGENGEQPSDARVIVEGGYTASGNEMYVNQTGRLLVQRVEKPFARVAYNSERFNVQGLWQRRSTPEDLPQLVYNANARSVEKSDVYGLDAQYNDRLFDGKLRWILGAQYDYQDVNSPILAPDMTLLFPEHVIGRFYGTYAQAEFQATDDMKLIGALRVDGSELFPTQVSPKFGVTYQLGAGHNVRATYNRSFLRPSYTDLYRRSPAGAPVNLAGISRAADSIAAAATGQALSSNMNLQAATAQLNLGNPELTPEIANSFEIGYKGNVTEGLFFDASIYYNRRTNLISAPLGGLAPGVYRPVRSNSGNAEFDRIADSVLVAQLNQLNPAFASRLALDGTQAALVIAPTNIAVVDELGFEISGALYLMENLNLNANYSYIDVAVAQNAVAAQKILPNTSRHRINAGLDYYKANEYDAGVVLRYVEGFQWQAGLFQGYVPAYAVVNVKAGYYVTPELRLGLNVFNLLDRQHYEIFGGTILRRQASLSASYSF